MSLLALGRRHVWERRGRSPLELSPVDVLTDFERTVGDFQLAEGAADIGANDTPKSDSARLTIRERHQPSYLH